MSQFFQAHQARRSQLPHAGLGFAAGFVQGIDALGGDGIFALGRNEFGTIDLEQGLSLGHRLAGQH
jgi:hypothetical protein